MLRSLLFYPLFLPVFFSLSFVTWVYSYTGLPGRERVGLFMELVMARWGLFWAGIRLRMDLTAIPEGETCIFVCNHQSHLDILVLFWALGARKISYVAKKSLFKIPVFGWALHRNGHLSIDRGNRRAAMRAIEKAVEAARNGRSIVIFPEGTRQTQLTTLGEFKTGGMVLAMKCRKPIVPLVLAGTGEMMPKGRIRFTPGARDVCLRALPPIPADRYSIKEREALKEHLHTIMNSAYQEIHPCPEKRTPSP